MSDAVLFEHQNGVITLTLNRPEKRNPISEREIVDALVDALQRVQADASTRVVILTGAGSAFSSGGDLRAMEAALEERVRNPSATIAYYTEGIQRIPLAFEALDAPVIAAVNGPAVGAGNDLACMCDMRIASEEARFAESFVKIGIIPGDGGAWLLPRVVGWSKACEMAFTGDLLSAQEALACGLVSQVVAKDDLLPAAHRLARRIAANPPLAVRATKRLMREGRFASLGALLQSSANAQAVAHTTEEHRQALAAALSKTGKR
jgi:enoyl-CoA hydratase/carnithine racemase